MRERVTRKTSPTPHKLRKLLELFRDKKTMLIVLQDNPDPDAISAAIALRKLANSQAELSCSIVHGGTIGRAENRALVKYLGLNLRNFDQIECDKFDLLAMIDTQPGTGNNSLPAEYCPDIIIDHHPLKKLSRQAPFTDIRSKYGATATIMLEYLTAASISLEPPMATALLYAIRSDTQDLGRDTTRADIDAFETLYPLANKRMLASIQRGQVQRPYFQMLAAAINNAKSYQNAIFSSLGAVANPDMIAEVCDLFLRDEHTQWVLCCGFFKDRMLISLRSSQDEVPCVKIIRKIVSRRGTGGGHISYAGGQIPLKKQSKNEMANLEKVVRQKFLTALNINVPSTGKALTDTTVK